MPEEPSRTTSTTTPTKPSKHYPWGTILLWMSPLLFLLIFLSYGVLTRPPAVPGEAAPRLGQPLPDFTLPDLQGNPVQLSKRQGNVIFINIWATWCPPCVEEMPTIQQLYEQLHGHGLEVLAISVDALGTQVVGPFMQKHRLTFPVLLDAASRIPRLYRTSGVPESFIVDKRGRLVEKIVGPRDWSHPRMIALFQRLLTAPDERASGSR
jgi:peroxiredoxin